MVNRLCPQRLSLEKSVVVVVLSSPPEMAELL